MVSIPQGTVRALTCTICQESPRDALRLPCFHIFCRQCLKGLVRSYPREQQNRLICPNCRAEADLPNNGVDAFPKALIRSTRPRNQQSSRYIPCLVHRNNYLHLFCHECEEVICKECRREHHKRHSTDELFKMVDKRKKEIENALQYEIQTNMVQLETDLNSATKLIMESQVNKDKDLSDLKKQAKMLKDKIDTVANTMVKDYENEHDLQQEDVGYQLQLVRSRINGSQQFIDEAFHLLSENDNDAILLNFRDLMTLKHDIRSQQSQPYAQTNQRLFSVGGANDQELRCMIGTINTVPTHRIQTTDIRPISRSGSTMSIFSRYSVLPSINHDTD